MNYLGSKRKLAKHIIPIMVAEANRHGINAWIEPFVGGANAIEHVPSTFHRYGYDYNSHAIAALTAIRDMAYELPDNISEQQYTALRGTPANPISSWVRFVTSFGGKFEGGYARDRVGSRNFAAEGRRNAIKQSPKLHGVYLEARDYASISTDSTSIIYCDPPYAGTTGYKTGSFDSSKFFAWAQDKAAYGHIVFVSEYSAPECCEEVFSIRQACHIDNKASRYDTKVEKLFRVWGY
jgi:DNA adenine methylase